MKIAAVACGLTVFGWALVAAADARHEQVQATVHTEVFVQTVQVEPVLPDTPLIDALVDLDEFERQSDCLWVFLQQFAVELNVEVVWAAGVWTDALGGACLVIGEDDE